LAIPIPEVAGAGVVIISKKKETCKKIKNAPIQLKKSSENHTFIVAYHSEAGHNLLLDGSPH
jgi:hypothetical protein